MKSLKQTIYESRDQHIALGHFNFSTLDNLHAILAAANKLDLPVVVGLSEGERDFFGIRQAVAIVDEIRHSTQQPIFLNADHTYTFDRVREVIDAGFDSVIFDGAKLELSQNIAQAKQCVDYARSKDREVLIEAEIGYIGSSSKLLDEIPDQAITQASAMPTVADIQAFVSQTGVDLIAPAVGNIHGMLKNAPNPHLSIEHIAAIRAAVEQPMVLHGGSGISNDDFKAAINAGIAMVHINTEMRKAWTEALNQTLADNPDEVAPYKIMQASETAVQQVVESRLALFAGLEV